MRACLKSVIHMPFPSQALGLACTVPCHVNNRNPLIAEIVGYCETFGRKMQSLRSQVLQPTLGPRQSKYNGQNSYVWLGTSSYKQA